MTIVALYARVLTKDKGQSTEKQLPKLRHFGLVPFIQLAAFICQARCK